MEHFYTQVSRVRQAELRKPGAYVANIVRKVYLLWDFFPIGLRSGASLLAWTEESIVETQDGDSFESMPIDLFRDLIRATPPLWKR